MNTKLVLALLLWSLAWWIIGIYDAWFWDSWCPKYFTSLLTLAVISIIVGYWLGQVEFKNQKSAIIYYAEYIIAINLWNVSWAFHAYFFTEWKPSNTIWLMPNCVVPIWVYWLMVFGGGLLWLVLFILMQFDKIKIRVEDRYRP